jgi:hypothetical protein
MLEYARDFNSSNNTTGCLLYYNGAFLHYLEGDRDKVLNLFERIKKDDRHSQVILLSTCDRDSREFESWSMAYENFIEVNHQLKYLKLVVSLYTEKQDMTIDSNPTSKIFWATVKKLLNSQSLKRFD